MSTTTEVTTDYDYVYSDSGDLQLTGSYDLNAEDFISLMLTQLQNQDPLEPQSNEDTILQLVQFSQLEQTTNMSNQIDDLVYQLTENSDAELLSNCATLIGKEVEYLSEDGESQSGTINSISQNDNGIFLDINGEQIKYSQISLVK